MHFGVRGRAARHLWIEGLVCLVILIMARPALAETATLVGQETCITCHEAQQHFDATFHGRMLPSSAGVDLAHSCETCHGPGSLHVAASGDKKAPGFNSINGPHTNPAALTEACQQCHAGTHPLWETSTHARQGVSCSDCHRIHQPAAPGPDQGNLMKRATITETCFQCHRDKQAHVSRTAHMPIKEGALSCATCHDPHGTPYPQNLRQASVNELCYGCHAEKRGPFLWEHAPVQDNCLNCHDPHGSLHDKLLVAKRPYLLCQTCHIGTRHPSTLYDESQLTLESNRVINRSCLNCHSQIHGSNHPSGEFFLR